jgi:hypothetical protein
MMHGNMNIKKEKLMFIILLLWFGRKLLSFVIDVRSHYFKKEKSKSIPHAWDITIKNLCYP